jgi:hypothetical protein
LKCCLEIYVGFPGAGKAIQLEQLNQHLQQLSNVIQNATSQRNVAEQQAERNEQKVSKAK